MEKIVLILRGVPGCGKSSLKKALGIRATCSADDYFMRGGKYTWSGDKIGSAHAWCQRKCRRFMKKQIDRIIIDNTFTSERELQPYIDLARQFGYTSFFIVVENRHGGVNSHNVPEETLEKMKNRLLNNIVL